MPVLFGRQLRTGERDHDGGHTAHVSVANGSMRFGQSQRCVQATVRRRDQHRGAGVLHGAQYELRVLHDQRLQCGGAAERSVRSDRQHYDGIAGRTGGRAEQ